MGDISKIYRCYCNLPIFIWNFVRNYTVCFIKPYWNPVYKYTDMNLGKVLLNGRYVNVRVHSQQSKQITGLLQECTVAIYVSHNNY